MYCTVDDIKAAFANSIEIEAAGTKITIEDCEAIIADESNYIDSSLYSKYIVPVVEVTSPKAFALLKKICVQLVCEEIRKRVEVKAPTSAISQDVKAPLRTAKSDVTAIVKGTIRLIDATIATQADGLSFGVKDESYSPFSLNKTQW